MKKSIIAIGLLLVYMVTFLLLFMKLRSMSAIVQEELSGKSIYYVLGIMFVAGISASFYLLITSGNTKAELSIEKESEVVLFEENSDTSIENELQISQKEKQALENIKSNLLSIANQNGVPQKERIDKVIWKLCDHFEISQALLYTKGMDKGQFDLIASYAFVASESDPKYILTGEGLAGQAVMDSTPYYVKDIPQGYLKVISGLGESLPKTLLIIPCLQNAEVQAVFELSSLHEYSKNKFEEIVSVCNYVSTLITK
jgi:hypothetical protein